MQLTRESFFAVPAPKVQRIEVPELGGFVWIKQMSAGERDRFEVDHEASKKRDLRARVTAASVCDEQGNLLFGPADVPQLSALPAAALEPIVNATIKLNAISDADVEELEKNS